MGIGICTFTEVVRAGPTKVCDILGIGLFDSCEMRVHPTGSAIARLGTMSQGQGHATTYAQIIVEPSGARHVIDYGGARFYFCCDGCKVEFERDPARYAAIQAKAQRTAAP